MNTYYIVKEHTERGVYLNKPHTEIVAFAEDEEWFVQEIVGGATVHREGVGHIRAKDRDEAVNRYLRGEKTF